MSQGIRILAVDDDPTALKLYQDAFEARGRVPIAVATNPDQAYAILDAQPIAAILLDLDLGPTNGTEILEHCQANRPDVRIYVISAHSERKVGDILLEAGAVRVFRKPVSMDYVFGELCRDGICEDPFNAIRPGQGETLSAETDRPIRAPAQRRRDSEEDVPSPSSAEQDEEAPAPRRPEVPSSPPVPPFVEAGEEGRETGALPVILVLIMLAAIAGAIWFYVRLS